MIVEGASVSDVEWAVVIVIGSPDDFFDQIKACSNASEKKKKSDHI